MGEDALPRPVAKYLTGLPPERQEKIRALIYQVHQALKEGADTEQIIKLLADNLLLKPEDELAMLESLARLGHPLVPEILQVHFGGTADKSCQKALKKAFHLLKTQGVEIPPDLVKTDDPACSNSRPFRRRSKAMPVGSKAMAAAWWCCSCPGKDSHSIFFWPCAMMWKVLKTLMLCS